MSELRTYHTHRRSLVRAAVARGLDAHVAVPPDPALAALADDGATPHALRFPRGLGHPARDVRALAELALLFRRVRPDIVHLFTPKVIAFGGPAARATRVPALVASVTGLGHAWLATGARGRLLRGVLLAGFRAAFGHPNARVIFQNPEDRRELVSRGLVPESRAALIPGSGVDLAEFRPTPEPAGPPLAVLAARLIWDKGVAEFVEAARLLRARGTPIRLALVGDTDPRNPHGVPEAELRAWQAAGLVEWWGHRSDMPAVLAASHIVCLPSRYREGVPKVLLEAAAAGRPIVTADSPGCRDALVPGETGLLVPPSDARALADALARLATDEALRRRMGAAARVLAAERFSTDHVIARTFALYDEVLEAGSPVTAS